MTGTVGRAVAFAALLVLLAAPAAAGAAAVPAAAGHYVPAVGDQFRYFDTIVIDDGTGNYTGYVEHDWDNGTETVDAVYSNESVLSTFGFSGRWVDNQGYGGPISSDPKENFSWSWLTFRYLHGTDNESGYTDPTVWFFMNDSLSVGATFYVLDTQLTVDSRDASFPLSLTPTGYAQAISASGSGSYERNDYYGVFTASYTWTEYFDPGTGYILGYDYVEHDTDGAGDGFTYTDTLVVTHTSYALTAAAAPPSGTSSSGSGSDLYLIVGLVVVLVIVVVVVAVALSRRRGSSLPRHSGSGQVNYVPGAPPPGPAPPPIGLIPSGQPPVQQIVMRETVKVNCRYCGTLMDSTATVCPNCGAPRS